MSAVLRRVGGRLVAALAGALAMGVALAVPGLALFDDGDRVSATFTTVSVASPTDASVVRDACSGLTASMKVTWAASPTSRVTGYRIAYGIVAGGPYTSHALAPADARSLVVGGLALGVRYHVVVEATTASWTSTPTPEVSVVTPVACLP